MENNTWYDDFINSLYKKFEKKTQLTKALMNLLGLEREAVYRRLRKDVLLSSHEIIKIASAWKISLDDISNVNSEQFAFQMRLLNYLDPSYEESIFLQNIVDNLNYHKKYPNTIFMDISNKLPRQILSGYEYLNQYYLFKWKYQYGGENEVTPFAKVQVSEEKRKITKEYYKVIKHFGSSSFIWDRKIFEYLVNDIKYFSSVYLITEDDKKLLKNDLHALLDYMNEIANKGMYPETQNKVNLYISQINVDTNYTYAFSPEEKICFIRVFEKYEIFSYNSEMVDNFMAWMQLKKRISTQISEVDERSRIEFFTKQRQIVNSL